MDKTISRTKISRNAYFRVFLGFSRYKFFPCSDFLWRKKHHARFCFIKYIFLDLRRRKKVNQNILQKVRRLCLKSWTRCPSIELSGKMSLDCNDFESLIVKTAFQNAKCYFSPKTQNAKRQMFFRQNAKR